MTSPSVLIRAMVENQNNLNLSAYSDTWLQKAITREWHYDLAASQEVAEFINSYWLPWWSKSERDMVNCRIELVDALHFMLSSMIANFNGDLDATAADILASYEMSTEAPLNGGDACTERDVIEIARTLQSSLNCDHDEFHFSNLFDLCYAIGFSLEQLYALYMGKSTLNKFRQDHGYRAGTYVKKWDGKNEDNYFLAKWVAEQENAPTVEQIRTFLDQEYARWQVK